MASNIARRTPTMSTWSYKHWKTHAEILASARASCHCDTQMMLLDRLIGLFIDIYTEDAPSSFDPEWFADQAKRYYYRTKNTLEQEHSHE